MAAKALTKTRWKRSQVQLPQPGAGCKNAAAAAVSSCFGRVFMPT